MLLWIAAGIVARPSILHMQLGMSKVVWAQVEREKNMHQRFAQLLAHQSRT